MARNPEKQPKTPADAKRNIRNLNNEIRRTRDRKLNKGQFSGSPMRRMAAGADAYSYTESLSRAGNNARKAGATDADIGRIAGESPNVGALRRNISKETRQRLQERGDPIGAPARTGGEKKRTPREAQAGASVQGQAGIGGTSRWDSHQKTSRSEAAKKAWATRRAKGRS